MFLKQSLLLPAEGIVVFLGSPKKMQRPSIYNQVIKTGNLFVIFPGKTL